jgi:hypothetical protein
MNRGRPDCKVTPDDSQWTMKGECDCGSEMMDVSLPIFPLEVQKRRIQMIDDMQWA